MLAIRPVRLSYCVDDIYGMFRIGDVSAVRPCSLLAFGALSAPRGESLLGPPLLVWWLTEHTRLSLASICDLRIVYPM